MTAEMAVMALPTRKEILTGILSNIVGRDEINSEAWDKALERGISGNSELNLEELVDSAHEIGEYMMGFLEGYVEGSK